MIRLLAASFALLCALPARGEPAPADPTPASRYVVHVINIGPGDELETRFGHIALMVDDHEARTRSVYNFGTYDFEDAEVGGSYLAGGDLRFWLSVKDYRSTVELFRDTNRSLEIRTLDLTAEQAATVNARLVENAKPANRYYRYHHSDDNCCTRVRDLLDDVLDGALTGGRDRQPTGRTYREWTAGYLDGLPALRAFLHFMASGRGDRPITRRDEQTFPEALAADLDATRVGPDARPLVTARQPVLRRSDPPPGQGIGGVDALVIALLAALVVLGLVHPLARPGHARASRRVGLGLAAWGLIAGLGGVLLALAWGLTAIRDAHGNLNLLVAPPLHLWLIAPGIRLLLGRPLGPRTAAALRGYLIGAAALALLGGALALGPLPQWNWPFAVAAIALDLGLLVALRRTGALGAPRPRDRQVPA